MRTAKYIYEILSKELHQEAGNKNNKVFGKRAHGKFFFQCVQHLQFCNDPNCHIKMLLDAFCETWEMRQNSEKFIGSFQ